MYVRVAAAFLKAGEDPKICEELAQSQNQTLAQDKAVSLHRKNKFLMSTFSWSHKIVCTALNKELDVLLQLPALLPLF